MALIALAYLIAAAAVTWHVSATIAGPAMRWTMIDMQVFRDASASAIAGRDVYEGGFSSANLPFLYPPFALIALSPLAAVDLTSAKILMSVLSVAALVAMCWLTVRRSSLPRSHHHAITILAAAVFLVSEPMQQNLQMGQVNVLIAAGVLADVLLPTNSRLKGITVGLLTGLKLTPALVAVFYALSGQWRAARNAAISFGSSVVIGTAVFPGLSWRFWAREVWASRVGPDMLGNQSLRGSLGRIFSTLGAPPAATTAIWLALAVLVGGTGVWVLSRAAARSGDPNSMLTYGGLAAITLLISPLSWTPHWISVAPLIIWCATRTGDVRRAIGILSAVGVALFAWPVDGVPSGLLWFVYPGSFWGRPDSPLWHGVVYLAVGSSYTIAGIALLGWVLWRLGPAASPTASRSTVAESPGCWPQAETAG